MVSQVTGRTGSRSMSRPNRAARNGVVASTKTALATVVRVSAVTKPMKAAARQRPPNRPFQPTAPRLAKAAPPPRTAMKPATTGTTNSER